MYFAAGTFEQNLLDHALRDTERNKPGCLCTFCVDARRHGPALFGSPIARLMAENHAGESEAASETIQALSVDERKRLKRDARNAARRAAHAAKQSTAMARTRRLVLAMHGKRTLNRGPAKA